MKIKIRNVRITNQWDSLGFSHGFDIKQLEGLQLAPGISDIKTGRGILETNQFTLTVQMRKLKTWEVNWFVQRNMANWYQSQYQNPRMTWSYTLSIMLLLSQVYNCFAFLLFSGRAFLCHFSEVSLQTNIHYTIFLNVGRDVPPFQVEQNTKNCFILFIFSQAMSTLLLNRTFLPQRR